MKGITYLIEYEQEKKHKPLAASNDVFFPKFFSAK